jgi:hypothetical protein
MSLSKNTIVDQITVNEDGIVMVRQTTVIKEDGVELSRKYHRYSFDPGSDVSSMPDNVRAICNAAWTPDVVAAYKAKFQE